MEKMMGLFQGDGDLRNGEGLLIESIFIIVGWSIVHFDSGTTALLLITYSIPVPKKRIIITAYNYSPTAPELVGRTHPSTQTPIHQ
jgi:hypothetical protein